jgi:solute carrier family 13 (sodium-dependent dicarboxylate transporter), member 2/3/5
MSEVQTQAVPGKTKMKVGTKNTIFVAIAVVLGLIAYFGPFSANETQSRVLAVAVFMLVLFITEPVPLGVAALLGCWMFWGWAKIPVAKAFSGFASDTPWFVLGGLLMGLAAEKTGLAKRIAYVIVCRFGSRYSRILFGMMIVNFLLTFLIPSGVAKTFLLCVICVGMLDSYGVEKGKSNIGKGFILSMAFMATLFDKAIIGSSGTILARNFIVDLGHVPVTWSFWFVAYLPIALINIPVSWWLTLKVFPPEKQVLEGGQEFCLAELKKMGPMGLEEAKSLILLCLATVLWATDFLHHVNPAIIGLGCGLVGCVPGIGVLKKPDFAKVNFPIVVFIGAAVTLGAVMGSTAVLANITAAMFKWISPILHAGSVFNAFLLYWYATFFHIILGNDPAMVAGTMPGLMNFAVQNGYNPLTLGLIWAWAVGGKFFIYQSAVLPVGYAFGYFTIKDLFKYGLVITVSESLILFILPLYWPLLGLTYR